MNIISIVLQVAAGAATAAWLVPAIISGVSALIGGGAAIHNARQQRKANEETLRENRKMQREAFERNQRQWQIENAYNSPTMQMQRYAAAGVNPNILFGQSQEMSSGNANSIPELSYPAYQAKAPVFDASSPINAMASAYQLANLQSQTFKNYKEGGLKEEQAISERENRPFLQANYNANTQFLQSETSRALELITGLKIDNEVKERTKDFVIRSAELLNTFYESQIMALDSRTELNESQVKVNDKLIEKYDREILKMGQEIAQIFAYRTQIIPSEAALNKSLKEYYDSAEAKVFFEAQEEQKNLLHWEENFNAFINKLKAENNLTEKQAQDLAWQLKHKFYTEFARPMVHDVFTLGGLVAGGTIAAGAKGAKTASTVKTFDKFDAAGKGIYIP